MAIHVNENGTIKEIGTKINGFKIDEVDLLWDNHLIPTPMTNWHSLSNLNKYRFLIIFYNYPAPQIPAISYIGYGFNCYDLDYVRQSGYFNNENASLALIYTNNKVSCTKIKAKQDENGIESFELNTPNSTYGVLVTAIGIACSTTE